MLRRREEELTGFGRQPKVPGHERRSEDLEALTKDAVLSRGLGRAYGDSALPPPGVTEVAGTTLADRILAFDPATGVLRAEAGLSLRELNRIFLPRGFFTPVSPGTAFVTLGGMVASDVHGKNHHVEGTFGAHVRRLKLRVADGRIVECSREEEPELFRATLGGMGLTGHVLEVEVTLKRIPSPWILQESERVPNIEAYLEALAKAAATWPMTVGWIDCLSQGEKLGRGILYKGRWAEPHEAPKHLPRPAFSVSVPFDFPPFVLGPWSVRLFNAQQYWRHGAKIRTQIVSPWAYFYPLDRIRAFNRMYGRRGLTQHQAVLPKEAGPGAVRRFLELLTARGGASLLCVIKDCGAEGEGMLSFPRPGISIALDIAVRDDTQALIDALNEFVIKEGGRIYLAKDAFTRPEHYRAMDGERLARFEAVRRRWDPDRKLRSAQSVRLFGDPA
ncbi:MAG: FAD-binding oxidoreductase [Myxococcaceae bacterium]|nr:FAD-binding oxidoreductase [Myxococcaceae bacterium]